MTALGSPLLSICLVSGVGRNQLPQEDPEVPWESQEGEKALEVLLAIITHYPSLPGQSTEGLILPLCKCRPPTELTWPGQWDEDALYIGVGFEGHLFPTHSCPVRDRLGVAELLQRLWGVPCFSLS